MRASSAVLTGSVARIWDLQFPAEQRLLARTRAAYVQLDGLLAFSKRDRDGQVDAYLAVYLPDEVALLFLVRGEVVNAAVLSPSARAVAAIPEALRHIRSEPERAEIAFHAATAAQLAAMFATCQQAPLDLELDSTSPDAVFRRLLERRFSGLVEVISDSRVNYLWVKDGRFGGGRFADQREGESPMAAVARLFTSTPPNPLPRVSIKAFPGLDHLPRQAPPAMVTMFRHFVWDLVELAEREFPSDAARRAERIRMRLSATHEVLTSVGGARGTQFADPIVEPQVLAASIADWSRDFLGELEVIHPQIATRLLKGAAREHRFALAAVGFFERLPWRVSW